MEPAWEELTDVYENSKTKLIGEIDCTSEEGEPLCADMGVKGYPTLKFGSVFDLQEYEGPRDFESLKKFSDAQLKPMCGLDRMQLCDKATRQEIRRLKKLTLKELDKEMLAKTESINELEKFFKGFTEDLEEKYEKAVNDRDQGKKEITDSGLAVMKQVAAERGIETKSFQKNKEVKDMTREELERKSEEIARLEEMKMQDEL